METKALKFKTNINCSGCVAGVKPQLDQLHGIINWEVDTTNPDKILTIESDGVTPSEVLESVRKVGFTIEPIF